MPANIEALHRRAEKLKGDRAVWESHWQEVVDWVFPNRGDVTTKTTPGSKKGERVVNSTALQALRILSAGLHGGLTSPSRPWFRLGLEDRTLTEQDDVKRWLSICERRMYAALNGSNFTTEIHECYVDLSAFGTACVYVDEDPAKGLRFATRHISEVLCAEDDKGRIDTVFRLFTYTARQCVMAFGEDMVSAKVREKAEKTPDDPVEVLHAVYPRTDAEPGRRDSKGMPFASVYMERETRHLLSESGYHEFPYLVPRWMKMTGETYGRSPAMDTLPDVKMVNEIGRTLLRAAHKRVEPPLWVPDSLKDALRTAPGSLNYYEAGRGGADPVQPIAVTGQLEIGLDMIMRIEESIRRGYFADLFTMFTEDPRMTATQALERKEEKLVLLGPTLGRLMAELLEPCLDRCFAVLWRAGALPPPPQVLQGRPLSIEYISPLAQAQRMVEVNAITRTLQVGAMLANAQMPVFDTVDGDRTFRVIGEISGAPTEMWREKREVDKLRQGRAQAMEQEAQAQAAERAVAGASEAAKSGLIEKLQGGMANAA